LAGLSKKKKVTEYPGKIQKNVAQLYTRRYDHAIYYPGNWYVMITPMSILLRSALCMFLAVLLMSACATTPPPEETKEETKKATGKPYEVFGEQYHPLLSAHGYQELGVASWYGADFHGKKTSTGEIYNMYAPSAAHKTLPFDTMVRVTNLDNGRQTIARINDRGPFVKGRAIDLSWRGASELGILDKGLASVKIEALGREVAVVENDQIKVRYEQPASYDIGDFTVQVGSFTLLDNAVRLRDRLSKEFENAHITKYDNGVQLFYRVRVTKASTLELAAKNEKLLEGRGFEDAFMVAD
jgi:rare lipoprotein A